MFPTLPRPARGARRPWRASALLAGLGGAALLLGASALGPAVGSARAQQSCTTSHDKRAEPRLLPRPGELVTVTLEIGGDCPALERKADVVLVIDRSSSMASDGKLDGAKDAALAFIDDMDAALIHVGIVAFDDVVEVMQYLTDDKALLRQAIDDIQWDTGTNLVDSLDEGRRMLGTAGARPDASPVIVFMTDGRHSVRSPDITELDPVVAAVRAAGIETYAIGLGSDADPDVLRRIASDEDHYYDSPSPAELTEIYRRIAGRIAAQVVYKQATIVDEIPANMAYETGSARPAARYDAAARTLTWTLSDVSSAGATLRFQVRPQEAGVHPTNVRASADYEDGYGNRGQLTFPVPEVEVQEGGQCICRVTRNKVPQATIEWALANPSRVYGWQVLLDPGKPEQPPNPRRGCLDLQNRGIPFHPLFNSVVWRAGCLIGPE